MYDPTTVMREKDMALSTSTKELLVQASQVYNENFDGTAWYGRCIFFSWFCTKGTCKFCYRSTLNHKLRHQRHMRSMGSMLTEALLCKVLNWRIEFLTGGYQEDWVFDDLVEIAKNVSLVYGRRIWVNLGALTHEQVEKLRPYIEGVCASIESPTKRIHEFVCPDKPIEPYERMYTHAGDLKKSACFIVGLGDTDEEFSYWTAFINKHALSRVTVYALKPVKGGHFTQGPTTEEFISWLARLRISCPTLEIIGGTNLRRCEEAGYMMQAGVNAITKFPATKQFGTKEALGLTHAISRTRNFISELNKLPDVDWEKYIATLPICEAYKEQIRNTIPHYLEGMRNPSHSAQD